MNSNANQYKCNTIWQQIIAIDVKFNAFRNPNISKYLNQILILKLFLI